MMAGCGTVYCPYQNTVSNENCDQAVSVNVNLTWLAIDSKNVELLIQWKDFPSGNARTF